jgi:hypothetical protein
MTGDVMQLMVRDFFAACHSDIRVKSLHPGRDLSRPERCLIEK